MVEARQNTLVIYPQTVAESMDYTNSLTKRDLAEIEFVRQNYSEKYHAGEYNRVPPHLAEHTWKNIADWRRASEEDRTTEYVEAVESEYFVIPTQGKWHRGIISGTTMSRAEGEINMRDVGKWATVAWNTQQHMNDLLRSEVGEEIASQYANLLRNSSDIEYVVVMNDDGIYAVANFCCGAALYGTPNSYKRIEGWADREGIDTEEFILRAMGEELLHIIRKGERSVKEEVEVRESLIGVYSALAAKSKGLQKGKYEKVVRHLREELKTVPKKYAELYSNTELVAMYRSDKSGLERVLAEEAVENGVKSDKGVKEYVTGKLEEIAEAAEGKGDKGGKGASKVDGKESYEGKEVAAEGEVGEDGEACAVEGDAGEGGEEGGGGE